MSEKMPNPEELKAIQEKHMTEEEIKMSEERKATFNAGLTKGAKKGKEEVVDSLFEINQSLDSILSGKKIKKVKK